MSTLPQDQEPYQGRNGESEGAAGRSGSMVREASTSFVEFERHIEHYELEFVRSARRDDVEGLELPAASTVYYQLAGQIMPPTQADFVGEYARAAFPYLDSDAEWQAIRYRAAKAYPSLVRQHHAELVLRHSFPWTFRSSMADRHGVDLVVINSERQVLGIALTMNTEAARGWAYVKEKRHVGVKPPFEVATIYCDPQEYVVGRFWLHDPKRLVGDVRRYFNENQ